MEGLLLFFLGPLIGILGAIASGIIALLSALLALIADFGIVAARATRQDSSPTAPARTSPPKPRRRKWHKPLATTVIVLLIAVPIANTFFFAPLVASIAERQLAKRGVEMTYHSLAGNFLTGTVDIEGLRLEADDWKIEVDTLDTNVGIWSLLTPRKRLQKLAVEGFRGECDVSASRPGDKRPTKRPSFKIDELSIRDATLEIHGGKESGFPESIELTSLDSTSFHSRYPFFALFFRSNLDGSVDGFPISANVEEHGETGRRTELNLSRIPLATSSSDDTFRNWFQSGHLSVSVIDEWDIADRRLETDFDWRLQFHDSVLDPALKERPILGPVASAFNESENPKEIAFSLKMSSDELEGSASETFLNLANALTDAVLQALSKKAIPPEELKSRKEKMRDAAKGLLDIAREKKP